MTEDVTGVDCCLNTATGFTGVVGDELLDCFGEIDFLARRGGMKTSFPVLTGDGLRF